MFRFRHIVHNSLLGRTFLRESQALIPLLRAICSSDGYLLKRFERFVNCDQDGLSQIFLVQTVIEVGRVNTDKTMMGEMRIILSGVVTSATLTRKGKASHKKVARMTLVVILQSHDAICKRLPHSAAITPTTYFLHRHPTLDGLALILCSS